MPKKGWAICMKSPTHVGKRTACRCWELSLLGIELLGIELRVEHPTIEIFQYAPEKYVKMDKIQKLETSLSNECKVL